VERRSRLTAEARADFSEILLNIGEDSPDAAERLRSEFYADQLGVANLSRFCGVPWLVFYKEVAAPLNFHLEQYEGPLDLLLDLIRKQQINIYDIPIASITQQYLEYMQRAIALDIELSSEFVYMAATLIHIKSRMLLPKDPELDKISPEEDPRQELVDRLLEHERFKNAAEMLQQKRMVEDASWSNPQMARFLSEADEPELAVSLFDLVKTLQTVLERAKNRPIYEVGTEDVSIPDMIRYLERVFGNLRIGESIPAAELFERQGSRRAMICLFLALLELVRRQALVLTQKDAFGDIGLKKQRAFDEVVGQSLVAIEEEYS
jgi:segregation and condensation protein A